MTPYRTNHEYDIEVVADPELLAQQRRQRRRRWHTSVGAVASLAALVGGLVLHERYARRVERQKAWDRLATCLVGAVETLTPEQASLRVRNAQLTVLGAPSEREGGRESPVWPARCGPLARRLAVAARREGSAPTLAHSSDRIAQALSGPNIAAANLESHVRALVAAAATIPLAVNRAPDTAEAPAPASPLDLTTLPTAARIPGESVPASGIRPSRFSSETPRVIVGGIVPGRAACALGQDGTMLMCSPLDAPKHPKITSIRRVLGTGGQMKLVNGEIEMPPIEGEAYTDESGECIVPFVPTPYPSALEDGSVAYIGEESTPNAPLSERFVRISPDGTYSESEFDISSRGIGEERARGSFDDIARVEDATQDAPSLSRCRANGTDVLAIRNGKDLYLSFLDGHRWSQPIESKGNIDRLQCAGREAILTGVYVPAAIDSPFFNGTLEERHCTLTACTTHELTLATMLYHSIDVLPVQEDSVATAYFDGKLVVVWAAGVRGGLRMRMAPFDRIDSVPDTVLYDDHIRAGSFHDVSSLRGFRLVAFASGLALFLETVEGTFALRIGPTGNLTPLVTRIVTP
ncbi:hypothetical protein LVJ94_07015 [Pendulispora rubella]|uniref:Secreted protein n=1 Tax=Pendulispora rubella TaxID=2741070 RepID=A0ABZ2L7R2_9BACT